MLLSSYIVQFPNVLRVETISTFLKYANTRKFEEAGIGEKNFINPKIRKVSKFEIRDDQVSMTNCHWANFFNYRITDCMNQYLKNFDATKYTLDIKELNQLDLLRYEVTNHYDFHVDAGTAFHRTLSAILFLNNDYKGGNLYFKDLNNKDSIKIEPYPGKLVVWPSNFLFPHSVEPVSEGVRYTIVAWA
jgi:Rps23 Pro-64 3,4-dihydroxylase Tpa1-like proline 4-hydroxylase